MLIKYENIRKLNIVQAEISVECYFLLIFFNANLPSQMSGVLAKNHKYRETEDTSYLI